MFYLLLVLLILDALLLSVVVLLQAGQGGGLASLGGGNTDTVLGGRQAHSLEHAYRHSLVQRVQSRTPLVRIAAISAAE